MNGPEHYRWAESALQQSRLRESEPEEAALLIGEAQVHATLAVAAAFIAPTAYDDATELTTAWMEVIR